ncbi:hypothetical protein CGRA01v4_09175 [Colletotrichum graminicola]|nr:hypothetical protein CGRA01v4_09175 [Colletotrichum graminicola]
MAPYVSQALAGPNKSKIGLRCLCTYREWSSHKVSDLSISRPCSVGKELLLWCAWTYRLPVRISVLTAEPPVETWIDVSQNHGGRRTGQGCFRPDCQRSFPVPSLLI